MLLGACAHLPEGRYAVDRVDIEQTETPGVTHLVAVSEIEDKIATAESPRFLGIFPRGVVLGYELYDRYVLERDLARIERLYRSRGYYEAHARSGRVEKVGDGHVRVSLLVEEGVPVNVHEVHLEGLTALPIDVSAAVLAAVRRPLRVGRVFEEERYETAEEDVVRAMADRGYAFAQVKGSVDVDLGRHLADVTLTLTPGAQVRIGAVTISGLGGVPEPPVRRALDLAEGELYSASKLESGRRAILGLGVFADVDVAPVLTDPGATEVPVTVHVVPSELRAIKLGGGIELDAIRTDVHLITGWEDRNFLGGLRRLTLDLRPGIVLYPTSTANLKAPDAYLPAARARGELRQPGLIEARTGGIFRGEFDLYPVLFRDDTGADFVLGYRDLSTGVGIDRTTGPVYTSLFYNFQTSFPFVAKGDVPLPPALKDVVISYLDLTTNFDFRDDPIRPHAGLFIRTDLQFAGVPVTPNFRGSSSLFPTDVRVQPEVRGYIPLSRKWTLALRATTGFLLPSPSSYGSSFQPGRNPTPDDIQLAFFRGFFSGGPNSNRGYSYRGVGPTERVSFFVPGVSPMECQSDPNSSACTQALVRLCENPQYADLLACKFPSGGLSLWEASVEVRFPIAGDLGGAVFCDASDVSRYRFDLRLLYPHLSCGAGLHYNTPVGPIRLDAGFQVPGLQVLDPNASAADKTSDSFYAIAIGIGEAF